MAQPRFAKSAWKEEEDANHQGTEDANNEHAGTLSSRRSNRGGRHSRATC
jgi:hypothetical protein